jgi:hypothetical protein
LNLRVVFAATDPRPQRLGHRDPALRQYLRQSPTILGYCLPRAAQLANPTHLGCIASGLSHFESDASGVQLRHGCWQKNYVASLPKNMCWDDLASAAPMYFGEGNQSRITLLSTHAQRAQRNIRQLAAVAAGSRGHRVVVGTVSSIADDLVFGLSLMPPMALRLCWQLCQNSLRFLSTCSFLNLKPASSSLSIMSISSEG